MITAVRIARCEGHRKCSHNNNCGRKHPHPLEIISNLAIEVPIIPNQSEVMPDIKAYRWHGKFKTVQRKLKLVSKALGESRKLDHEEEEIKKMAERRSFGLCQEFGCDKNREGEGQGDPLEICPKEIWTMILGKIEKTDDVMSCYYTCHLFRNLLETRMITQAFFVLDDYLYKNTADNFRLEHDDFLHCRLVSTPWKLAIDRFLQNHPSQLSFHGNYYPSTVVESEDIKHLEGLIERLIKKYQPSNSNPFPSRHLTVKINSHMNDMDYKIFHTAVTILLKYFGKHVWYFTFQVNLKECGENTGDLIWYQTLYGFLNKTWNLKMADLCFSGVPETEQGTCKLEQFVRKNKFPKLNNLTALKIDAGSNIIVNCALKRNKHITKLMVSPATNSNHNWIKINGSRNTTPNLPNLTDLSLLNIRSDEVTQLEHVNWPLSRLTLESMDENGNNHRYHRVIDLKEVFKLLENKFQSTLTHLSLKVSGYAIRDLQLCLPNLEELEVHFGHRLYMDFILPLRSLKSLKVNIYDERNYNDEHELEIIKFKDHVKQLHKKGKTNIWQLFPELNEVAVSMVRDNENGERVEVQVFRYTRYGDQIVKQVKQNLRNI